MKKIEVRFIGKRHMSEQEGKVKHQMSKCIFNVSEKRKIRWQNYEKVSELDDGRKLYKDYIMIEWEE